MWYSFFSYHVQEKKQSKGDPESLRPDNEVVLNRKHNNYIYNNLGKIKNEEKVKGICY